jgi:AcrR family transcriptional regulator
MFKAGGVEKSCKNRAAAQRLLWEGVTQPRRGRRHSLTVDDIISAALTVGQRDGMAGLSMRAVARELEVGVASLYTYVPNKAALLALMSDAMIGMLPLPHTLPGDWRDQTQAWALDEMMAFQTYPWLAEFDDNHMIGPSAVAWLDSAVRVFEPTGMSAAEALTAVQAVTGYIRGHVTNVLAEDQSPIWSDKNGIQTTSAEAFRQTYQVNAERYPALESLDKYPSALTVFESGLSWLLDGIAVQIDIRGQHS